VGEWDAAALTEEGAQQRRPVPSKKKKLQADLHATESERVVQSVPNFRNGAAHFNRRVLDGMLYEAVSRVPTSALAGRARHRLRTSVGGNRNGLAINRYFPIFRFRLV
jgi:hypothetical protein